MKSYHQELWFNVPGARNDQYNSCVIALFADQLLKLMTWAYQDD
jgi:hypothetical protein